VRHFLLLSMSLTSGLDLKTYLVVVLSDPFRGMGAWRNSTEAQQSGHAPRFGPEVKNGSGAKDSVPEKLRCGIY